MWKAGIDHLAVDLRAERLFVAALGNNTVEVLDLKTGLHLKSLAGFHEPQGIAVLTDAGVVAVANGQGDGVQLLDAASLTSKATVTLGDDADNVRVDASAHRASTSGSAAARWRRSARPTARFSAR